MTARARLLGGSAALLLGAGLTGCDSAPDSGALAELMAADPAGGSTPVRAEFDCGSAGRMVVDFNRSAGTATVQPPQGNIVILPQVPDESGVRFSSDSYELTSKGRSVLWQAMLAEPLECSLVSSSRETTGG